MRSVNILDWLSIWNHYLATDDQESCTQLVQSLCGFVKESFNANVLYTIFLQGLWNKFVSYWYKKRCEACYFDCNKEKFDNCRINANDVFFSYTFASFFLFKPSGIGPPIANNGNTLWADAYILKPFITIGFACLRCKMNCGMRFELLMLFSTFTYITFVILEMENMHFDNRNHFIRKRKCHKNALN